MIVIDKDLFLVVSPENLVHFQCPHCKGWWSIGDAPKREHWFCPWCGEASAPPGDYMPEEPSGEEQWYTEDTARERSRQVKVRLGTTRVRPEFPIVYDED